MPSGVLVCQGAGLRFRRGTSLIMPELPGVNHKRAMNAFEKAGFWIVREGKHISMTDGEQIIIIPRANPINSFTMAGTIKDAELTIEEFKKPL